MCADGRNFFVDSRVCIGSPDPGRRIDRHQPAAIGLRPLVPAQGEATRLTVTGEFPFGNGIAALDEFEVVPELVTVDLTTSWTEGTSSPDGGGSTIWAVTIDLGDLEQALSFE